MWLSWCCWSGCVWSTSELCSGQSARCFRRSTDLQTMSPVPNSHSQTLPPSKHVTSWARWAVIDWQRFRLAHMWYMYYRLQPEWLLGLRRFMSMRRFRICSLQHRCGVTGGLKVASPLRRLKLRMPETQRPRGGRTQLTRCLHSLESIWTQLMFQGALQSVWSAH